MSEGCVKGTENEGRINSLEKQIKRSEIANDKKFDILFEEISEIKNKLLGRPSWPVVFMLTGLSTLCVGLIVRMIS